MWWLFTLVQKLLQISILSLATHRGCLRLFAWVGVNWRQPCPYLNVPIYRPMFPWSLRKNEESTSRLSPERGSETSQSISNHTHACLLRSTSQRSEIVSTMGRPHPPLRSSCGQGFEGASKPGPGSHTLPRTELAETDTVREICSSHESPAWRMLLVTSSLTTSRTSSSFSGGKRSASRSRAWRAVVTTSGSGVSLTSISATIKNLQRIVHHCKCYLPSVTRRYTPHGGASTLLA